MSQTPGYAFSVFADDRSIRANEPTKTIEIPKANKVIEAIANATRGNNDRWPVMGVMLDKKVSSAGANRIRKKIESALADERQKGRCSGVAFFCPIMTAVKKAPAAAAAEVSSESDDEGAAEGTPAAAAGGGASAPGVRTAADRKAQKAREAEYASLYRQLLHGQGEGRSSLTDTRVTLQKMVSVKAHAGRDASVNITDSTMMCFEGAMAALAHRTRSRRSSRR